MAKSRGMLAGVLLGVALATVGCASGGGMGGGKVEDQGGHDVHGARRHL